MRSALIVVFLLPFLTSPAAAWHDATHMAIAKAAGLDNYYYLAVGADMAKEKAEGRENPNHWCNNPRGTVVTPKMVLLQVEDYDTSEKSGHLYGAIVASLNRYRGIRGAGKYANYPLGYAIHYLGDLSMPFHNTLHVGHEIHTLNDGVVEGAADEGLENRLIRISGEIRKRMAPIRLPAIREAGESAFNGALATEIAKLANESMRLGYEILDQGPRNAKMTEEQAYTQLAKSASLLQAVYAAHQ